MYTVCVFASCGKATLPLTCKRNKGTILGWSQFFQSWPEEEGVEKRGWAERKSGCDFLKWGQILEL